MAVKNFIYGGKNYIAARNILLGLRKCAPPYAPCQDVLALTAEGLPMSEWQYFTEYKERGCAVIAYGTASLSV